MDSIIRQGELKDIPQLIKLAKSFPLCNLPDNENQLAEIIEKSHLSFKNPMEGKQRYLFVLEFKGKVIGSSQILSYQEKNYPYFLFHKKGDSSFLQLVTTQKGQTQLGGLIVDTEYRASSKKLGRQIGLFRFLYIAENPEAFTEKIEVSLTAPLKGNNTNSSFWDLMNFSDLPKAYPDALLLYKKNPSQFFSLFPKTKDIPLKDLTEELKISLKTVHPATFPVYKGLLKLGLKKTRRHHVLDGGLFLERERKTLPILKQSRKVFLKKGRPEKEIFYLWGQKTSDGFSGGLISGGLITGEVKENTFLLKKLPSVPMDSEVRIMPLYPFDTKLFDM